MRWPFTNWLRGAPGKDDPAPEASEVARSAADAGPGPGPRVEARPAAWRDAPPVQRAVGPAPITAPSVLFARGLAGRRAPDPMLAPLGHDMTADGPAGLVSGIAVPLVQRAPTGSDPQPAPALPAPAGSGRGRPRARRAVTSVAARLPSGGPEGPADDSPLESSPPGVVAGPTADEPAGNIPGLAPRTLPVARLAMATPAISATRVADATAPAPVLAVARTVASSPPPATVAEGTDATGAGSGGASGPPPDMVAAAPPLLVTPDGPAHPVVARRSLGESRRLGLGAPLTGRPPSAQWEIGRSDLPVARLARLAGAPRSTPALPPIAPVVPASAASPPVPRLAVARRPTTPPATVSGPVTLPSRVSPAPSESAPPEEADPDSAGTPVDASTGTDAGSTTGDAASSTRPLVGDAPIGISRLAREDGPTDADAGGAAEQGVTALRLAGASSTVPAGTEPADGAESGPAGAAAISGSAAGHRAGSAGVAAVQPRLALPTPGESSRAAGPSPATRSLPVTAPLVADRAVRASLPTTLATLGYSPAAVPAPVVARITIPSSGLEGGGESQASVASFGGSTFSPAQSVPVVGVQRDVRPVVARTAPAVDRGTTTTRTSVLPLIRSAAGAGGPEATEGPPPGGALSWTAGSGFTTAAPRPGPFVQRGVEIDEPVTGADAQPAGQAEQGATAGPDGQTGPMSAGSAGTDYEELAEHVYDRIRARLTTELLLDRERAGMLVDA